MEEIKYPILIEAFKAPKAFPIEFWKKVAYIERNIPKYNNKYIWWERVINFCNTYLLEHAVNGKTVTIAGLWTITLELNTYDNHETFHEGRGKGFADFYFEPTRERGDLKIVDSLQAGLERYAKMPLPYNSDYLLFYCLDTARYFMVMPELATIELNNYGKYKNFIYYEVKLPVPELLSYKKPVEDDTEILADLPEYTYIKMEKK